ncbi:unnamed protein product [Soboliphyme baturini]|uniref:Transposase n=1 Tax=Soboliphyme baturini TaxID=241478 RepID=A0A183IUB0_9BILA|nr:unnamed protein product [Soboliphyme baturini]
MGIRATKNAVTGDDLKEGKMTDSATWTAGGPQVSSDVHVPHDCRLLSRCARNDEGLSRTDLDCRRLGSATVTGAVSSVRRATLLIVRRVSKSKICEDDVRYERMVGDDRGYDGVDEYLAANRPIGRPTTDRPTALRASDGTGPSRHGAT